MGVPPFKETPISWFSPNRQITRHLISAEVSIWHRVVTCLSQLRMKKVAYLLKLLRFRFCIGKSPASVLMLRWKKILHHLIGSLSHVYPIINWEGFIHPRWLSLGFFHQQYHWGQCSQSVETGLKSPKGEASSTVIQLSCYWWTTTAESMMYMISTTQGYMDGTCPEVLECFRIENFWGHFFGGAGFVFFNRTVFFQQMQGFFFQP